MRMTTWNIPNSSSLADACHIPVAAILQPFAEVQPGEQEIPVVECDESGPARCEQCRGYLNCWCTWISGGSKWICNLCRHHNNGEGLSIHFLYSYSCSGIVLPEHFCALDSNQVRLDYYERPDLSKGTIDFTVPSSYFATHPPARLSPLYYTPLPPPDPSTSRQPEPLHVVFAIDVSVDAIQCGFTQASCVAIKGVLFGGEMDDGSRMEPCFPEIYKAGFITFDRSMHFYDISVLSIYSNM